jgi:hypothetical protein
MDKWDDTIWCEGEDEGKKDDGSWWAKKDAWETLPLWSGC